MNIKQPRALVVFFLILFVSMILKNSHGQTNEINYAPFSYAETNSEKTEPLGWSILDKLAEKDDELMRVPVSMGKKEITYHENRISILPYNTKGECDKKRGTWDGKQEICKSVVRKKLSDKERGIGLKLLNSVTGNIDVIKVNTKITANGVEIVSPPGYQIEMVEEPNGVKWNYWYTFYRVLFPENTVIIKNNFPRETTVSVSRIVKGKVKKEFKKMVQGFLYVPHSEFFEQPEQELLLVKTGIDHIKNDVSQAFVLLRERGVQSKAFPDKLVADVEELSPKFFERIPLLEQGDYTKFRLDPEKTVKRTLIRLGTNGESAWKYTCNGSKACGWVQFTDIKTRNRSGKLIDGTYTTIRKIYPTAKLNPDFKEGAADHVNSMMADILLFDYNLDSFLKRGNKKLNDLILKDQVVREELLDSGHNGNPKWAYNSLSAAISKGVPDWVYALSPTRKDSRGGLRTETRQFMFKLRYLVENDLP